MSLKGILLYPILPYPWRVIVYPCVAGLLAALILMTDLVPSYDDALVASGERLAAVQARRFKLTKARVSSEADLKAALAQAFSDGEALGKATRPTVVLQGSTATHTLTGPTQVGEIKVKSSMSAAIVVQPGDGQPYAKGTIATTVSLPRFNYSGSFEEPVSFYVANLSTAVCVPPEVDSPPVAVPSVPGRRSLLGVDGGLVLGSSSAGYELGGRFYPRSLAYSGRLGEARLGAYARVEQGTDTRVAAGVSVLFGVGRMK